MNLFSRPWWFCFPDERSLVCLADVLTGGHIKALGELHAELLNSYYLAQEHTGLAWARASGDTAKAERLQFWLEVAS